MREHSRHLADGHCASCAVRSVSLCSALREDEFSELEALAEEVSFADRDSVTLQGDPAQDVFNITAGTLRVYKLLADGRRQIVGFLSTGDFMGLALSPRYAFSADAVEPVRACRFSRIAFTRLIESKPHLLLRLHQAASHELALAQDHMMVLGRRTAEEKVAAFIIGQRDKRKRLGGSAVMIPLMMSRTDIGDYLGLTIETVSRTLSRMARDKTILVVPGGIRLLNAGRLEELAAD